MKLKAKTRSKLNGRISDLTKGLHRGIVIGGIADVLESEGIKIIQEDGTEFSGIFCGAEGSSRLELAARDGAVKVNGLDTYPDAVTNALLVLTWYKVGDKMETVAYVS